jgi:hypothetical protein
MNQFKINYDLNDTGMIGTGKHLIKLHFVVRQNCNFANELFLLLMAKFKFNERKF